MSSSHPADVRTVGNQLQISENEALLPSHLAWLLRHSGSSFYLFPFPEDSQKQFPTKELCHTTPMIFDSTGAHLLQHSVALPRLSPPI